MNVLVLAMPFAGIAIPSIQLPILKEYLKERNIYIQTEHLYLKAAEFYGLNNYNFLISFPNDSYTAQMIFSKYVFPEHWKKNKNKFIDYFNKKTSQNNIIQKDFSFEHYIQQTDDFLSWVYKYINWSNYDIIGFTINYGQLLPSLALAKKIKEFDHSKKIVFGGSRTINSIGVNIIKIFNYVDFIVSGDGEEPLYLLALDYNNYKNIPNLIYRQEKEIIWNKSNFFIDINSLPLIYFDSYFETLSKIQPEFQQYFSYYGRLPIEISRGCWWNKCTFCNQKAIHPNYRVKNIDRIIEELLYLSEKYRILNFQFIGETFLKNDFRILLKKIIELNCDFSFVVEIRAGQLTSRDYQLLREAGFDTIQTGIETFSTNYIRKMNKGVRVIDNIAVLKYCKENGIKNEYNIVVKYPNEDIIDFEETKKTIKFFKQYIDPPRISLLRIGFGCDIYNKPILFNIKKLDYTDIDKIMYPSKILNKGISFFYNYFNQKKPVENDWEQLVYNWKKEQQNLENNSIKSKSMIDKLIFYFVDGGKFLKIYDKRNGKQIKIYEMDKLEREIFLSCIEVVSFKELVKKFFYIPEYQLAAILNTFEQKGIVFREDDFFLSLPLKCNYMHHRSIKEESKKYIYSSGIQRSL